MYNIVLTINIQSMFITKNDILSKILYFNILYFNIFLLLNMVYFKRISSFIRKYQNLLKYISILILLVVIIIITIYNNNPINNPINIHTISNFKRQYDNVIITMNLGNREFINYTKPLMVKYSQKTNSQLIIINNSNIKLIDDYFNIENLNDFKIGRNNNKSYLYKILVIIYYSNLFDKILWVDDTCFIKNNCENLFDMLLDNDIMAYNEGENKDMNSWKHDEAFIRNTTGFTIDTNKYINSGMVVYSNKIKEILNIQNTIKYKKLLNAPYPHQAFLNFIIQYFKVKLKIIPSAYNCMFLNCSYNEDGRKITPDNIGEDFILSDNNSIFHITGFYKNRLDIVKYISNILSNEKRPKI